MHKLSLAKLADFNAALDADLTREGVWTSNITNYGMLYFNIMVSQACCFCWAW